MTGAYTSGGDGDGFDSIIDARWFKQRKGGAGRGRGTKSEEEEAAEEEHEDEDDDNDDSGGDDDRVKDGIKTSMLAVVVVVVVLCYIYTLPADRPTLPPS